jgi:hypothetical protein
VIGSMIISEYQLNPALLGFGIPQRTASYITGKFKWIKFVNVSKLKYNF